MSIYRHSQTSRLIVGLFVTVTVVVMGLTLATGIPLAAPAISMLALLALGFTFARLTVEVDADAVRVWFGPGWIRRTIPVSLIGDARPVRNSWWYGWGIRKIPGGWMFNVSGLDAVELDLTTGSHFRIGTDEPEELAAAIQTVTKHSGH